MSHTAELHRTVVPCCSTATAGQLRTQAPRAQLKCLVLDCDGVILESEDLHRRAYNAVFENFNVQCGGKLVEWDTEFYDVLQNKGGLPSVQ
jgi:hypothetical protein